MYKWILYNWEEAIEYLPQFKKFINILDKITPEMLPEEI